MCFAQGRLRRIRVGQQEVVFVVFAVLFVVFSVFLPGFLSADNMLTLLQNVAVLGILGLAMAIVVLGRGIDISLIAALVVQGIPSKCSRINIGELPRFTSALTLALALILSLLYLTFHSVRDALMIFSGVLFARVGGVLGLWVMGLPFTISAGVGFVALAGASMLEGLVLVSAIRDRIGHAMPKREAIEQARLARLRPVLMTGTVAALGFLPMMLSTGIGAEVQRPLATVVFFGMVCDTFLTMLALPVLYLLFGEGPEQLEAAETAHAGDGAVLFGHERVSEAGPRPRKESRR